MRNAGAIFFLKYIFMCCAGSSFFCCKQESTGIFLWYYGGTESWLGEETFFRGTLRLRYSWKAFSSSGAKGRMLFANLQVHGEGSCVSFNPMLCLLQQESRRAPGERSGEAKKHSLHCRKGEAKSEKLFPRHAAKSTVKPSCSSSRDLLLL